MTKNKRAIAELNKIAAKELGAQPRRRERHSWGVANKSTVKEDGKLKLRCSHCDKTKTVKWGGQSLAQAEGGEK